MSQQAGDRPAEQARSEDDHRAADREHPDVGKLEGLARERGEDERRHEDVHVDIIGGNHVGTPTAAIDVSDADDGEDREDDVDDLDEHCA